MPSTCISSSLFLRILSCSLQLSAADLEVLSAGSPHSAVNGVSVWRVMPPISLPSVQAATRYPCFFLLRSPSHPVLQYNSALHFAAQTHMCVLTPHWFDDARAICLGRRIPETPNTWSDPPVLHPSMTLNLGDDPLTTDGRRKRKPTTDTDADALAGRKQHECSQSRGACPRLGWPSHPPLRLARIGSRLTTRDRSTCPTCWWCCHGHLRGCRRRYGRKSS